MEEGEIPDSEGEEIEPPSEVKNSVEKESEQMLIADAPVPVSFTSQALQVTSTIPPESETPQPSTSKPNNSKKKEETGTGKGQRTFHEKVASGSKAASAPAKQRKRSRRIPTLTKNGPPTTRAAKAKSQQICSNQAKKKPGPKPGARKGPAAAQKPKTSAKPKAKPEKARGKKRISTNSGQPETSMFSSFPNSPEADALLAENGVRNWLLTILAQARAVLQQRNQPITRKALFQETFRIQDARRQEVDQFYLQEARNLQPFSSSRTVATQLNNRLRKLNNFLGNGYFCQSHKKEYQSCTGFYKHLSSHLLEKRRFRCPFFRQGGCEQAFNEKWEARKHIRQNHIPRLNDESGESSGIKRRRLPTQINHRGSLLMRNREDFIFVSESTDEEDLEEEDGLRRYVNKRNKKFDKKGNNPPPPPPPTAGGAGAISV